MNKRGFLCLFRIFGPKIRKIFLSLKKCEASADIVRTQLNDLSRKIHKTIQPVFVSHKINQHLKTNNLLFTNLNVTCAMQVMLALHDGTYINAWTNIDTPLLLLASISVTNTLRHRKISLRILPSLKKCNSKFDCLIYDMFFINELRPSLNVQCDSIRAKVFK